MQSTLLLQTLELIRPIEKNQKHIQILFSGRLDEGHWICTYHDGKKIYIFDSTNRGFLTVDEIEYLVRLYPFKPPVVFMRVDEQPNSVD